MISLDDIKAMKDQDPKGFWSRFEDEVDSEPFTWLLRPGEAPVATLWRELLELDLKRYALGLPATYHSDDPFGIRTYPLIALKQAPMAMSLGRMAGVAVVWDGLLRVFAVGRRSSLELYGRCWYSMQEQIRWAVRLLPVPECEMPAQFRRRAYTLADPYIVRKLDWDPDLHVSYELRQSTRIAAVRRAREDPKRMAHYVAEHWPRLRQTAPGDQPILKVQDGKKMVLGGAVWVTDYYKLGHHWDQFGGWGDYAVPDLSLPRHV